MNGDSAALHRARVASRRLRELLPLLGIAPPKARKRIRKLTELLGRVRELDVSLQLLEREDLRDGVPRLAVFETTEHVRRHRDAQRARMLARLHRLNLRKLDRDIDAMIGAAARQETTRWRRVLATRLTRRSRRLRDAMTEAGAIYVAERLHGVRIAAKKLRYGLEIAAEFGVRDAAKLAAVVRRAQVTLGDLQDRNVLLRELRDTTTEARDETVGPGLLALAGRLEEACRELHAQYLAQRAAVADVLAAIRQQIVPALAPARRRALRAGLAATPGARRAARGAAAAAR